MGKHDSIMRPPFTPDELAERWKCSGETVRAMIREGQLPAFRVGRMLRIRPEVVEEHECRISESDASAGDLSSCGTRQTASDAVIVLRHARQRTRSAKPAT